MDANRIKSGDHQLRSELARLCLPEANRDASRKLAWMNSICILFLVIGLAGARSATPFTEPRPRVEDVVPAIIETVQPPSTAVIHKVETTDQNQTATPKVVAVTINMPVINFSVPTIGNVMVPNAIAQPPSTEQLMSKLHTLKINSTGETGERPQPPYPPIALSEAQQGSVSVSIIVDDTGTVTQIALKESSGYPLLDRSTGEFIKRHWHILPAHGSHIFETTITYKLTVN